jgi:hypothetical protein
MPGAAPVVVLKRPQKNVRSGGAKADRLVGIPWPTVTVGARTLRAIIGWGCASLLGALGWWLGEQLNLGAAVILGAVASGVGLYYGYKWFDNNLR